MSFDRIKEEFYERGYKYHYLDDPDVWFDSYDRIVEPHLTYLLRFVSDDHDLDSKINPTHP
jgi:hypothetical protein